MNNQNYTTMTRYYRNPARVKLTPDPENPTKGTYQLLRGSPKACLITLTDGKTVWFGMSRCHEADNFSKARARQIAFARVERARFEYQGSINEFEFNAESLRGALPFEDLRDLLDVFYNLDKSIYRYLPVRDEEDETESNAILTASSLKKAATSIKDALISSLES